jgi:hypothetical protein
MFREILVLLKWINIWISSSSALQPIMSLGRYMDIVAYNFLLIVCDVAV